MSFTIAIDGPAASGKGTISREIAKVFGMKHLDTGEIYREVASRTLERLSPTHSIEEIAIKVSRTFGESQTRADNLRSPEVTRLVPTIAAIPEVRTALVDFQRDFARRQGGAVLDGRDIGTVICPEAEVKLFVTASDSIRADRRYRELIRKGVDTTPEAVLADLRERDARDSARATAPLKPAADAIELDTSTMSIEEAVARACEVIRAAMQD